jgi:hypothetical protein
LEVVAEEVEVAVVQAELVFGVSRYMINKIRRK